VRDHNYSRDHDDALADALPPLVVDRQRIVRCAAFRRLQQKTQVFVAPESDHFRTRLTHTLEVAHLARTLAGLLRLNAELAEIVALAHDLGHPPFGHAGEAGLNDCMKDHGGFEHNRQTLRIVEELEHPYPEFHGLNLTRVVRECLAKHHTQYDRPGTHPLQDGRPPPAEGQVVDLADRLTYALHDLQDGLYAELLDPGALRSLSIWRQAYAGPDTSDPDVFRRQLRPTVDRIEQRVFGDLATVAARASPAEVGRSSTSPDAPQAPTVRLSDGLDAELRELDAFLFTNLYRHPTLVAADEQARGILADVFQALVASPALLPPRFQKRVADQGVHRVVADYVAGMTDRFCLEAHAKG
jgi:dGTPase